MHEARQIAFACCIGGMVCAAAALGVAPKFWWLGLLAGMAAGYVSYNFREVWHAIPQALEATSQRVAETLRLVSSFFTEPHPIEHFGLVLGFVGVLLIQIQSPLGWWQTVPADLKDVPGMFFFGHIMGLTFSIMCLVMGPVLVAMLAAWGANILEDEVVVVMLFGEKMFSSKGISAPMADLEPTPITYGQMLRWVRMALALLATMPIWLPLLGIVRIVQFLWNLYKLVRKHQRRLCAFDGALGGGIAYLVFHASVHTPGEYVLVVLAGGVLGAALGIADWAFVSKRWLKVAS